MNAGVGAIILPHTQEFKAEMRDRSLCAGHGFTRASQVTSPWGSWVGLHWRWPL